jgi:steroid delta-isomerase-like uncharacterized protein
MTTDVRTPADTARAAFDALNAHDLDGLCELIAPDDVNDFVALEEFRGRDAVRGFFAETLAAFPDFSIAIDRLVTDEVTAVVQWHAGGTFRGGVFQGIRPTGRAVELRGVDVMDITEGVIRHNTIYYDGASLARQIGLLPRKNSAADRGLLVLFNATTRLLRRPG